MCDEGAKLPNRSVPADSSTARLRIDAVWCGLSAVRNSFVINESNIVTAAVLRISSVVKAAIPVAIVIYFNRGRGLSSGICELHLSLHR